MGTHRDPPDVGRHARWLELQVPDEPESWRAAGFTVVDDGVIVGDTTIRLTGEVDGQRGIQAATISGLDLTDGGLDGLDIGPPGPEAPGRTASEAPVHPNGVTSIDHVVVLTPDLDRTIAALATVGLGVRRIRHTGSYGAPMRQAFFRIGSVILEVVGGETGTGEPAATAPATWFGLALHAQDLDALARELGPALGTIKDAVQQGHRIATVRGRDLGISVAVAVMDTHPDLRP